ncbi:hypothetical protein JW905_18875 [bacterium]|nr:hypothetical protein [candidate division CSSED10-310 bacterium]
MTPWPQSTTRAADRVPVLLLLGLALLAAGCDTTLLHGLDERAANEIIVVMEQSGIKCRKIEEHGDRGSTWAVSVPRGHAPEAWRLLRDRDLPRKEEQGFAEVFAKKGLIPTTMEEKAMMLHALSGELSHTIETIEGIVDARVHLVIPEVSEYLGQEELLPEPSAAVLAKYRTEPAVGVGQIAVLVAHSVQGLSPDRVSVLLVPQDPIESNGPAIVSFMGIETTSASWPRLRGLALAAAVLLVLSWGLTVLLAIRQFLAVRRHQETP